MAQVKEQIFDDPVRGLKKMARQYYVQWKPVDPMVNYWLDEEAPIDAGGNER